MEAGKLRYRVEIQTADIGRSTTGQELKGWSTIATVWAGMTQVESQEADGKLPTSIALFDFILRPFALTSRDRIKVGSEIYNIVSVPITTTERTTCRAALEGNG